MVHVRYQDPALVSFGRLLNVVSDELAVSIFRTSSTSSNVSYTAQVVVCVGRYYASWQHRPSRKDTWQVVCEVHAKRLVLSLVVFGLLVGGLNSSYCHGRVVVGGGGLNINALKRSYCRGHRPVTYEHIKALQ